MKVSLIVPAFNEEHTIAALLRNIQETHIVDQIICVNDGSSDNTKNEVQALPGIQLVDIDKNHGKAAAVAFGIEAAEGEIVIIMDADLEAAVADLKQTLEDFITPIAQNRYDMVIGHLSHHMVDAMFRPLSGQRAFRKSTVSSFTPQMKTKGYALELFMNYSFRDKRIHFFPLRNIRHITKKSHGTIIKLNVKGFRNIMYEIVSHKNSLRYLWKSYFAFFADR